MELVIGHVVVFILAAICQIAWLSRGHRNTPLSGVSTLAIGVIGVAVLGWWALATVILGGIFGPVLARMLASPAPTETIATPSSTKPQESSQAIAGGGGGEANKPRFSDKPKNIVELFDEGRPTLERISQLREWAAKGDRGADYELACALLLVDSTAEGISEAVAHLEKAATHWHGRSAHFLTLIYADGKLVPADTVKVSFWKTRLPNKNTYSPESRAYLDSFVTGYEMWKAMMLVRDHYLASGKKRAEAAGAAEEAAKRIELVKQQAKPSDPAAKFEAATSQGLAAERFPLLQASAAAGHPDAGRSESEPATPLV
jgi:hypothetical protein